MGGGAGVYGGSVRVAAVRALAHTGGDEHKNLALAVAYAEEAASKGARPGCKALEADQITSSVALVGEGLALDSVALLEFIAGVEEDFAIFLDDQELTVEHFESLRTLARYVHGVWVEQRQD